MLIDSHCHLDDEAFQGKTDQIIEESKRNGVELLINNSCNYQSMLNGETLANKYNCVFATIGMHPHDSKNFDNLFIEEMKRLAPTDKIVAVGEIGLDYYYDLSDRATQKDVFALQIELADKFGLPITLHVRDAYGDAADILQAQSKYLNHGVLWHCYSGSAEFARQMVQKGHFFAFGGAITFKNAKKQDVIEQIPSDRVLSETDSPYMAPVPLRGTTNTPANIPLVVAKLAEMYNISTQQMEERICRNTFELFPKITKFWNKMRQSNNLK